MSGKVRIGWYNDHDDATLTVDVATVTGFDAMAGTFSALNSIGRQVGRLQTRVQFEEN